MNKEIFLKLYNLSHSSLFLDNIIIFFADIFPYLVILIAGLFLLFHHEVLNSKNPFFVLRQKWKEIVLVFFSSIFAWFLAQGFKILIKIPRPVLGLNEIVPLFGKESFSFPSGHATFFMALATAIFLSHKKAGYVFGIFALIIGFFRIVAGVHFPIDILAGFILGILIALSVNFFYRRKNNLL
jgi:membrane-associated phospholipid phosphatase